MATKKQTPIGARKSIDKPTVREVTPNDLFNRKGWYIYNGLRIYTEGLREQIDNAQKILDTEKDIPSIFRASYEGMISHLGQAEREFREVLDEMTPLYTARDRGRRYET